MINILQINNMFKGELFIDNEDLKINSMPKNSLLVINNIDKFTSEYNNSWSRNIYEEFKEKEIFLFITNEAKINFEELSKDTDNYLSKNTIWYIPGDDITNEKIITNLKQFYDKNNIDCNLTDDYLNYAIDELIEEKRYVRSNVAELLYKESSMKMLLLGKESVDEDCIPLKKPEKKQSITFDKLVGLDNVKKQIDTIKNYLVFNQKLNNQENKLYLNSMFLGNPGTGKTTVARMYADMLYEIGAIKKNKLVEIIPTELMAKYIGQTGPKVRQILNRARGGVLFIDEAYLIAEMHNDSFMPEAMIEIMKYLEDRDNVVIFAGYKDRTRKIYDMNPGLKSRIPNEIIFEDYKTDELYKILKNSFNDIGIKIDTKAKRKLLKIIELEKQKQDFGNGRYCLTLKEQLLVNHANRKLDNENFKITIEDIKDNLIQEDVCKIGFRMGE